MIECTRAKILDALSYIDPDSYDDWVKIGMALEDGARNGANITFDDWDNWSRQSKKYKEKETNYKWGTFTNEGITIGTLFYLARDNNWQPSNRVYGWNDSIPAGPTVEEHPKSTLKYIKAVFKPGDTIAYSFGYNSDGLDFKVHFISYEEAVEKLEKGCDIASTFMDYNHDFGALIHANPMDGKGFKVSNVTDFRHTVIESDEITPKQQIDIIKKLNLPCAAITFSGRKSMHAVVKIDAENEDEYKDRVKKLNKVLEENGFKPDKTMKAPNKKTRIPGVIRGEAEQRLIYTNVGCSNFVEWENYLKTLKNDLPNIQFFDEIIEAGLEPLAPEAIEGVLRQGHKLYMTGPSKAAKSTLLIELLMAFATGGEWLGLKCRKSKVLYINLEIDSNSFNHRVENIRSKLGITIDKGVVGILNLRGHAEPLQGLTDKLINRAKDYNFDVIIIDPLYKVQGGDENSAGDITMFTNEIDRITEKLNCSVICTHHHPKGDVSNRQVVDRGSGSGVFGRDADALIDLIELEWEPIVEETAWRAEFVLREFAPRDPIDFFFDHPIHRLDTEGVLADAKPITGYSEYRKKDTGPNRYEKMINTFDELAIDGRVITTEFAVELNWKVDTLKKRIREFNKKNNGYQLDYLTDKNFVVKKIPE